MLSTTIFSVFLLCTSAVLIHQHLRSWRTVRQSPTNSAVRQYAHRQFCRRMLASALVGTIGMAIFAGHWVRSPWIAIVYWGICLVVVTWILLLAAADLFTARSFIEQLRQDQVREEASLRAAARSLASDDRNGDPAGRE